MQDETVWLTQSQMVELFGRDVSVISRHINNVFKEGEVDKKSNLHFLQIANSDRPVAIYSLDVIISVGYGSAAVSAAPAALMITGVAELISERIAYSGLTGHVNFIRHSDLSDGDVCFDEIIKK